MAKGYSYSNLYPGMNTGVDQNLETVPDPAEQAAVANVGNEAPPPVDRAKKLNMFWVLVAGIVIMLLLGRG